MKIYTLGHSTRTFEEFLRILKKFGIKQIIDVRRFPSSKKFPWFNKENLKKELEREKIEYVHSPELGGYRKEGYENFTKSEEFKRSIEKVLKIMNGKTSTILCAERFFWRCHRKYIANYLAKIGHEIVHILDENKIYKHKLKSEEIKEKMRLVIWCDKKAKKLIE